MTGFLGDFVLQVPNSVLVDKLFVGGSAFWQNATFKAAHVEEQIGVVLGVDGGEGVVPLHSRHRTRQAIFNIPKDRASKIHVVLFIR